MASWYQSLASRGRPSAARIWQPRSSSSVIISKGLLNAPGENNCFLNSAVQVLWHLDVFRRSFREIRGHACMGKACIFCALKVLFTQLQYSEQQSLPPDALRKALAVAFQDQHRFQLGFMDDAAECFENILTRIHFHLASNIKEDLCDAKHCISHQKFAMTLIEHSVCRCGATSEPLPFTQMVHYVSCTALCAESKKLKEKCRWSSSVCFGQVLRNASAIGDIRDCPSECGERINIRRVLMNCPDVVSIGLVWDSDHPEKEHILDVIQCLGTSLRMPDLFNAVIDDRAKQAALHMVGVVTYYGKHYSTFFYNTALRVWVYFDDATVKQVGPNWRDVVSRCKRGHSQPLLLLFANPNGSPVLTETAPRESTMLLSHAQSINQTGTKSPRPPIDSTRSGNNHHNSALHAVRDQRPYHKNHEKESSNENVVEIGHDALRTISARKCSDHNPCPNNLSLVDKDRGTIYETSRLSGNDVDDKQTVNVKDAHGGPPDCSREWMLKRTTYPAVFPYSENKDAFHYKISENTSTNSINDRNKKQSDLHLNNEVNVPLENTGKIPQPKANYLPNGDIQDTSADKLLHPRRLERHESWSGRPSQPISSINLLQQPYRESRHSVQRHNSFCQRSQIYSQPKGQTFSSDYSMSHFKTDQPQSLSSYSASDQPIQQFGSVPNLHTNNVVHSLKSSHVLNIALAQEGILANAIKNSMQHKKTSTSDMLSSSKSSLKTINSHLMSGSILENASLSDLRDLQHYPFITRDNEIQHKKNNSLVESKPVEGCNPAACQDQHKPKDRKEDVHINKNVEVILTQHLMDDTHGHNSSIYKQTTRNSLPQMSTNSTSLSCHGLNDRDSVASKDSGYRSKDRSSASSESVYCFESPPLRISGLQDAHTVCNKVFGECDEIEAKSRRMGDAGDLAAALALCSSAVTRLKECFQLEGVCSQTRQLLHNRFNKAVLQSRNLHRRMTLLREQDFQHPGDQQQSSNAAVL